MSSTRVLVAGATGRLGRAIVDAAAADGLELRALGRSAAALSALAAVAEPRSLDLLSAPAALLDEAMAGMDAVISSVGASILPELGRGRAGFFEVDTLANQRLIEA